MQFAIERVIEILHHEQFQVAIAVDVAGSRAWTRIIGMFTGETDRESAEVLAGRREDEEAIPFPQHDNFGRFIAIEIGYEDGCLGEAAAAFGKQRETIDLTAVTFEYVEHTIGIGKQNFGTWFAVQIAESGTTLIPTTHTRFENAVSAGVAVTVANFRSIVMEGVKVSRNIHSHNFGVAVAVQVGTGHVGPDPVAGLLRPAGKLFTVLIKSVNAN
jgi:hypothetical protein